MAVNRVTRTGASGPAMKVLSEWGTVFPGSLLVVTTLLVLAGGGFENSFSGLHLVMYTALICSAVFRIAVPPTTTSVWAERTRQTDMVLLPLCGIAISASAFGSEAAVVFPLTLLVLVWASASLPRLALWSGVGFAVLAELGRFAGRGAWAGDLGEVVMHLCFIAGFAAGGTFLLRHEVTALRRSAKRELEAEELQTREEARSLGLDGQDGIATVDLSARMSHVGSTFQQVLEVSKQLVEARSVVLMTQVGGDAMRVWRSVTDETDLLRTDDIPIREGLLGVACKHGLEADVPAALRISPLEGRTAMLPYYTRTPARIRSVMAVPLRSGGGLIGCLWFDRGAGAGFGEAAAASGLMVAELLTGMLETERTLLVTESRSNVLDRLIVASRTLAEAFTPEEVYRAVLTAASQLTPMRFGALMAVEPGTNEAIVLHAVGEGADDCTGARVAVGSSLGTMVLKAPTAVPPSREWNRAHGTLLADEIGPQLDSGDPVLALPLVAHARTVGGLVLCGSEAITDEATDLLSLLCAQAAVAVEHALALAELQSLASTDPLTGLDNRTTLESKLEQSLARSRRAEQELAVLILDLDHFKNVNDTYGHQMGDLVLRQVSKALDDSKRLNDSVGRLGGEEFVLVLENTGDTGARLVAERIRERISKLAFPGDDGTFNVTASIGFSVAPRDGSRNEELVRRADNALYQAKNDGRDQVRGYRDRLRPPAP